MKKQIKQKKKEVKKEPLKIFPNLYDWCEDAGFGLFILGLFSCVIIIAIGWTAMTDIGTMELNLHGINPWFIFGLFILISELIFIWIANNAIYSTDMPDVAFHKFVSLFSSAILTIWILSGFIFLKYIIKNISLEVIWNVVSFFGIGAIVIGGTYLYLKVNQWIAKKVSTN